ncbi:MAG: ATP-binding protein [Pseudomonadota bacterium]
MTRGRIFGYGILALTTALLGVTIAYSEHALALVSAACVAGLALGFVTNGGAAIIPLSSSKWFTFIRNSSKLRRLTPDHREFPTITINGLAQITDVSASAATSLSLQDKALPIRFDDAFDGLGQTAEAFCKSVVSGPNKQGPLLVRARHVTPETFFQLTWLPATDDRGIRTALLTDATELKSLEAQFVQGQKMQAIGQLAGGVAHDFNNLLTAISGYCDLLLLDKDTGHRDYEDLRQISNNANRAAGLVAHLLAFSRRQTLRPDVLDVNALVSQLSALLNRLVGEKVTLRFTRGDGVPSVYADGRQLEQVIMNLVVNARDAMPSGGDIQITTEMIDLPSGWSQDRVTVPAGGYVLIEVQDNGTGMPPDVQEKIFEPFYTTKKQGEGTGLGLSTVYGIVKQTGGYIFVDSVQGQGTRFSVYLPVHQIQDVAETVEEDQKDVRAFGLSGLKLLLVEDEAPVRAFAARALALQGVIVVEADSGEAALEKLEDGYYRPDLVVSDVVMPGMNGPEWVLEARKSTPDMKVIFVSGYSEDVVAKTRDEIEGAMFLPKPYSLAALIDAVQTQANG